MTKKAAITDIIINNWDTSKIFDAWNRRCDDCRCPDDEIFVNDEDTLEMVFEGRSADWILARTYYGRYHYPDDYFCFNGYGNLDSFNHWTDTECPVDVNEIADWLIEYGDADFEIDTDLLMDAFIKEYYEPEHHDEMRGWIEKITEEETFDLLTEDWDDLYASLKTFSGLDY